MKFYDTIHSQITEKITQQLSKYSSTLENKDINEYYVPRLTIILQWLMQLPENL